MSKKMAILLLLTLSILLLGFSMQLSANAGSNNQNDENGKSYERGTGKINGLDGCRPPESSGNYWVYVPADLPPGWSSEWEGGPCCPSNMLSEIGNNYPLPNQCCNPPDYMPSPPLPPETPSGEQQPGNHCLCFEVRGWPIPNAMP